MKLLDIYAKMTEDIQHIERRLDESVRTEEAELNAASLHLLKAGGKRIRPVFVLLAGRFGTYDLDRLSHVAVALELIHMATLVHDDVIDDAATRRGQPTVKAKWDERIAMYTGDYILGKALAVAAQLERPDIHRILSKAMVQMVIGEMEQFRLFYRLDQSVRDYLLRIRRKTALLIAVSCQLGALAAGASDRAAQRLYAFGYNAGMAFQIRDDILDLMGTEQQLGKPPGSDMRQGNVTLPVLYAIRDERVREAVRAATNAERPDEAALARAIELVRSSPGIEEADALSRRYIDKAIRALDELPDIPAKDDFEAIANFIAERAY
ncbi:polyprenyl synthetase family protein [Paenibacillus sp.]|uniref:polyprenyl synthetase family protein n=1 Tax=Paenibacillus sp. TaxID=58172 RepID=UPI002D4A6BFC|nr:polyprenyl synthetase family protein [Paenibacillus sp.]HZG85243.1 polyprenyl synthetase family protein [Paenibacillus sp.]